MARRRKPKESSQVEISYRRPIPWRRMLIWLAGGSSVLLLLLLGPRGFGQWCRHRAAVDLDTWALTDAQQWLQRADWLDARNAATALMRAQIFRYLRDERQADASLQRAEKWGATREAVQRERTLAQIQSGELGDQASTQFQTLMASGASPQDVSASFISGAIVRSDRLLATQLLDAWERDLPNHPQVAFLRGALYALTGDQRKARAAFERTLALEPRHDLARFALAQTEETENRIAQALRWYRPLASAHPKNELIASRYARCLRKSGRLAEANAALEPLVAQTDASSDVDIEMINIALERGDYRAARQRLDRANASRIDDDDVLTMAGIITLSMLGETVASDRIIVSQFNRQAAKSLVDDLQTRLAMNPFDGAVAAQWQLAGRQLAELTQSGSLYESALPHAVGAPEQDESASGLYALHCESCHGTAGDGDGVAARHVFPRPRDLRREPMRLVSTENGVPSREDLASVIEAGIPGTSMVPLKGFSRTQLDLLVDEVIRMRREGVRAQYLAQFESDETPDEADVNETVAFRTDPGAVVTPPELGQPDEAALALGKRLYAEQACLSCHGEAGTGDQFMPLFDVMGRPCFPRDLVHDLFKGENRLAAIYLRIQLGMPGTPHPASVNLTSLQLAALTYYCHSLGREPKQVRTNHQRAVQAWRRPAVQWAVSAP